MDNVKLFRIDYRLLHWQTGVLWVQKLKANMILVAGDKVAADDMRKNLIKLAAPKSVKTRIVPIAEAAAFLNSENVKKYSIELLVETTDDALALAEQVPYLRSLNAALMKTEPGKKLLTRILRILRRCWIWGLRLAVIRCRLRNRLISQSICRGRSR